MTAMEILTRWQLEKPPRRWWRGGKELAVKQHYVCKWQKLHRGTWGISSVGILRAQVTQFRIITHTPSEKGKKKKHQCQPEIGNSGTRKKTRTSGHTKQQKKRVFFCLLFPFFTHIYIYTKASCHFQCVHMNGRQNADAAVFFWLSCSSMLNWHFTDRGGCWKIFRRQKRLIAKFVPDTETYGLTPLRTLTPLSHFVPTPVDCPSSRAP